MKCRYTVKYYNGENFINDFFTDSMEDAIERERILSNVYGKEFVLIADSITEILVG